MRQLRIDLRCGNLELIRATCDAATSMRRIAETTIVFRRADLSIRSPNLTQGVVVVEKNSALGVLRTLYVWAAVDRP